MKYYILLPFYRLAEIVGLGVLGVFYGVAVTMEWIEKREPKLRTIWLRK